MTTCNYCDPDGYGIPPAIPCEICDLRLRVALHERPAGAVASEAERIAKAVAWGKERLRDCENTMRTCGSDQRAYDSAYAESLAIGLMLRILRTGEVP